MSKLIDCSSEPRVEICWCWFDIHFVINEGVPPRYSSERFEAYYKWKFTKVLPEQAVEIMDAAHEEPWQDMAKYRRPVFTRNNDFSELINGHEAQYAWFSSSVDCVWDDTVGYEDSYSVSIDKDSAGIAAWYGWFYGHPFEWEPVDEDRVYRVRAMVKTEGVTGSVRVAAIQRPTGANPIYSDYHFPENPQWQPEWNISHSEFLTGDNDWTMLFADFKTKNGGWQTIISLELEGQGKCWFDDVVITKVQDLTGDGEVNLGDFAVFSSQWNKTTMPE